VLEKYYLYDKIFRLIDGLYTYFLKLRISAKWQDEVIPKNAQVVCCVKAEDSQIMEETHFNRALAAIQNGLKREEK